MAEANRAADQMPELADLERKDQIVRVIAERERGRQEALLQAERLETDRKLLADLEAARGDRADQNDPKRSNAEYAAAFRKAGLDQDATDPKQAGAWIAGRSAPIELASFLDDWTMVRRAARADEKASARLIAAARAADPDPCAMPCAPAPVPGTPRRSRPSTSWPVMRRHWTLSPPRACGYSPCG